MKIDMQKAKYYLFSLLYIATIYWMTRWLNDLQGPYLRGLLGLLVFYFSFRALYWPIKWVKMKDFEDILSMTPLEFLETLIYFVAFGFGIASIANFVVYLFKMIMTFLHG